MKKYFCRQCQKSQPRVGNECAMCHFPTGWGAPAKRNTNPLKRIRVRYEVEYSEDGFAVYSTLHSMRNTIKQAHADVARLQRKMPLAAVRIVEVARDVVYASISTVGQAKYARTLRRIRRNERR